jgi:hypothetical protein
MKLSLRPIRVSRERPLSILGCSRGAGSVEGNTGCEENWKDIVREEVDPDALKDDGSEG